MKSLLKIKNAIICLIFICIFPVVVLSLSGTWIIDIADDYKENEWICNAGNARPLNKDGNAETSDLVYPFIAKGEIIGKNSDGTDILSEGKVTGVPYASGLRDTVISQIEGIFKEKIDKIN